MWTSFWNTPMDNDSQVLDARSIRHAGVAYEGRDLHHRAVFFFFLALGVVIVLVYLAMWGMFKQLGGSQYAGHRTTNPIMTSTEELTEIGGDPANSFPMPHLQPDPVADLYKFRIREEQRLNTYGWVDQAKDKIHIPIETAIDILAASWPASQQEQGAATAQASAGQGANSAFGAIQSGKAFSDDRGGNYGW
jgi:hypothetical protein